MLTLKQVQGDGGGDGHKKKPLSLFTVKGA